MFFKSIPFLKILLPYLIGISYVFYFGSCSQIHFIFFTSAFIVIVSFIFQKVSTSFLLYKKWLYIFSLNIFLFLLAFETTYLYRDKNSVNHYSHYVQPKRQGIIAVITDIPIVTDKFTKLMIDVNYIEHSGTWHHTQGKTILYINGDSFEPPEIGRNIFLRTTFAFPSPPMNPGEFDYKMHLEHKNIFHVANVHSNQIALCPILGDNISFVQLGAKIRSKIVSVLRTSGLSHQAFSICSALLIGYDDEIEAQTIQSFSHSGTLHILSVSGMHTGILYAALLFLFSLFDKHNRFLNWQCIIMLSCLAFFVFVTGISPSVLRAAIMLSLIIIGKTFYKQGNSLNTLLFSAFIILLVNPYLIFDAGFLLSYFAVLGIIILLPLLKKFYFFENKIIQWIWLSVLISVAATTFTLPISLYFFHQFPLWFVFSNLLIIPISTIILFLSALLICFCKILFIKKGLVVMIQLFNQLMLWVSSLTDNSSYGYIDDIFFSKIEVILCFALITTIVLVFTTKQYKMVMFLLFIVISWLCFSLYINFKQLTTNELVVFYIKKKSTVLLRIGQTGYLSSDSISKTEFERYVKPYIYHFSRFQVISSKSTVRQLAHYCIVSHNKLPLLIDNNQIKPLVVADCSNNDKFVQELKKVCRINGYPFYSVKENGAIQLRVNL